MLNMKSRAVRGAALFAGAALTLTACGGGDGGSGTTGKMYDDCDSNPNTCNSVERSALQDGGTITYASEKEIKNWNTISTEGNVLDVALMLKGTQPYTFYTKPDLSIAMNKDLLASAEQTQDSPQTIVYEIKQAAKWSDGTPITAKDFIYNWKVQNGEDCPSCSPASTSGYELIESVEGSDNGKTVTVTFSEPYTDWKGLWSSSGPMLPAHIAAKHGDIETADGLAKSFTWFGKNKPTWSGGPYKISKYEKGTALTLTPNENYWGQKPKLDRLVFRIITKASEEPKALANREVDVIYPQPQVDLVNNVRNIQGVSADTAFGLSWEHADLNLDNPFLAKEPLRDALFTVIDRQAMIDKTVGQFADEAKPLNNYNFMPQSEGYRDVVKAQETGHGTGNVDKAKKTLTDAGYNIEGGTLTTPEGETVEPLRVRYTAGNQIRQNEAQLIKSQAKKIGVDVKIEPTDDLGGTLSSGEFDIAIYAWVSSPYPFSGGVQLWSSDSGSNFGNYSNEEVDRLVQEAVSQTDRSKAVKKLNDALEIMSEDAYVLPLYQKPTFVAAYNDVANVRNNPSLDGPTYNVGEWGLRQQ